MVVRALTDPDVFFRGRTDDLSFLPPVGIVLTVALIGVLAALPTTLMAMDAAPEGAGSVVTAFTAIGVLVGFVSTFVVWLVYAAAFHGISAFFDGEGAFATTLKVTGWGYLPAVLNGLVNAAVQFYAFRDALGSGAGAGPGAAMAAVSGNQALFLASSVVGIAFTLWQGVVWTFGVRHARNLELREAAITVGIPVAFAVLLALGGIAWQLFFGRSMMG